ncbi:Hypothetical predicted protein [Olea europaea subsp. europaea]|uniref:Uncharacterized protein n=1 Tax=Olea europaea subsp. europaea TaxID=158383 RepID=A0A8S0UTF9_OLEEU|nr:Hypothetical predicted protein [Olea europaea subsp. europaea]
MDNPDLTYFDQDWTHLDQLENAIFWKNSMSFFIRYRRPGGRVEVGLEVPEEAGVEVPEEVEIEGVEGGLGVPEGETRVPEGVIEEVAEESPEVVVEVDEGVAEDERMPEMTDDDVVFVSEGATKVPKGKKRANDALELMVGDLKSNAGKTAKYCSDFPGEEP